MDIENAVKNAVARANQRFQAEVEKYQEATPVTDEKEFWYIRRMRGMEKALPAMIETALTLALTELLKEREENR